MTNTKSRNGRSNNLIGAGVAESDSNFADKLSGGNKALKIVIIVIIVIIILWIIYSVFAYFHRKNNNEPMLITQPIDGSVPHVVSYNSIPTSNSNEFTMNFWIFVRDWNYNYNHPKCVLYRGDPNANQATPMVFLYPNTNKLMVRMSTGNNTPGEIMNPFSCNSDAMFNDRTPCDISNIPIQRWVMCTVILWNTTTDVYINGKLARSCTYQRIPQIMSNSNIYTGQGGGFNGYLSRLKYFNYAIDPRRVYQLYRTGPYKRTNFFHKIGMQIKGLFTRVECVWDKDDDNSGTNNTPDPNAFKFNSESEEGASNVCWSSTPTLGPGGLAPTQGPYGPGGLAPN